MSAMITGHSVVINGGNFSQTNESADKSCWQKLYERAAKGALHDSQERSRDVNLQIVDDIVNEWKARFRCTTGTSNISPPAVADPNSPTPWPSLSDLLVVEDVIKDVLIWLHDPFTHSLAMWLYDDKKACTSLVAQVVAKVLSQRKELSATYFFPGSPTSDIHTVVPTIAYQLGRKRPAVKSYISTTLEKDIAILHSNLRKQMKKLVVNPLTQAPERGEPLITSKVILIHALEDFEEGESQDVLDTLIKALASIQNCPFAQRLLIIGRPTPALREYLSRLPEGSILQRSINNKNWQAREEDVSRGQEALRRVEEMEARAKKFEDELGQLEKAMAERKQEAEEQERMLKKRLEEAKRQGTDLEGEEEQLKKRAKEIDNKRKQLWSEEQDLAKSAQGVGMSPGRIAVGKPVPQLRFADKFQRVFGRKEPEPICIAVIGRTGSGKTHIINCLKHGNNSEDLGNDMLLVSPVKIDHPEPGRSIILIDTPGRNPWNLSWNNIFTMLNDWLADQRKCEKNKGFKLSGVLYLHPIGWAEDTSLLYPPPLEIIEKSLGKKVAENVLFATTMWDKRVDEDERKQMEVTFQTWKRTEQCRVDRFDNTTTMAWRLIDRLLTGN